MRGARATLGCVLSLPSSLRLSSLLLPCLTVAAGCNLLLDADPQFTTGAGGSGSTTTGAGAAPAGGGGVGGTSGTGGMCEAFTTSTSAGAGGGAVCEQAMSTTWATTFADAAWEGSLCAESGGVWSLQSESLQITPPVDTGYWAQHNPGPRLYRSVGDSAFVALTRVAVQYPTNPTHEDFQVAGLLARAVSGSAFSTTDDHWLKWEVGDIQPGIRAGLLAGWDAPGVAGSQQLAPIDLPEENPIEATLGMCRTGDTFELFYRQQPGSSLEHATLSTPATGFSGDLEVGILAADWTVGGGGPVMDFHYFVVRTYADPIADVVECESLIAALEAEYCLD